MGAAVAGRKNRDAVERFKSAAWGCAVLHAANASGQNSFDTSWAKRSAALPGEQQIFQPPRIDRIRSGNVSPSHQTLKIVERYYPGTSDIYHHGPGQYSLWEVMGGTIEASMRVIRLHVKELHGLEKHRPPLSAYIVRVIAQYYPITLDGVDFIDWQRGKQKNVIAAYYKPLVNLPPTILNATNTVAGLNVDDVAVLLSMYRLALFVGDEPLKHLYFIHGVWPVMQALLHPWGIDGELVAWINGMWEQPSLLR